MASNSGTEMSNKTAASFSRHFGLWRWDEYVVSKCRGPIT